MNSDNKDDIFIIHNENIKFADLYGDEYNSINHFSNWPVVYIIYNKSKEIAYVGETVDLKTRLMQHYQNQDKSDFRDNSTRVIFIDYALANKSTCLDLESFLIFNMRKDEKFELRNGNSGLQKYDYYDKNNFENVCKRIWEQLYELKIVSNEYNEILKKKALYSPFLALNQEQNFVVKQTIKELIIKDRDTIVINGDAGTGKTAVAVHLLKLLQDYANNQNRMITEDMVDERIDDIKTIINWFSIKKIKIGIIFPMETICDVIKKSVKKSFSIEIENIIFQPVEAVENYLKSKQQFDILIVDEAQRLAKKGYSVWQADREKYIYLNNMLNIAENSHNNQLEWIEKISKKQVLFYDNKQRIRKYDIEPEYFNNFINHRNTKMLELTVQERCLYGGEDYINCLRKIFNSKNIFDDNTINEIQELVSKVNNKRGKNSYKFLMYNDVSKMVKEVQRLFDSSEGKSKGMCYTLSGDCWPKKKELRNEIDKEFGKVDESNYDEYVKTLINKKAHNVEIGEYKNILNSVDNWINRELYCRNEIGVLHTVAGLDAEYVGVIIGHELKKGNNMYKEVKEKYYDRGKNNATDKEILEYILDTYYILCSRARKGTFIYVCNPELREVFSKFMKIAD